MNESQENAIEMYSNELMGALTVKMNSFIPYLEFRGTIIRDERTTIEGMQHDFDKMISLLKLLKQNKNGWKVLHDFLMHNGYPALAQKLQAANTTEATNESGDGRGQGNLGSSHTSNSLSSGAANNQLGDATQERILQEKQNRVLQNHLEELSSVLSPTLILTHLSLKRIITKQEEQMITKDPENFLDAAKIKALFHLMSRDPQWWDILMKYLEDHRFGIHKILKEDLKKIL